MQKLDSLTLPKILPHEKALKSLGQNVHNYEPEFWEFFYETDRYLKNVDEKKLISRYSDLCRNFRVLTSAERHIIPINSFLSSWYWYLKEHQTRYEFYLRGIPLPNEPPIPRDQAIKPYSSKSPNACDIIFRYGHLKFMKEFVEEGKIRISPASKYNDGKALDPRTDDELNKHRWQRGDNIKIVTKDNNEISIIGDLQRSVSTLTNYYTLCLSCDFEPVIFEEFEYDACVVIKKPDEFVKRLEEQTKRQLPSWFFHHNPIEYFDSHEPSKNQYFNAMMFKDFSYAYQMEYRFMWIPPNKGNAKSHINVTLGSLDDICELFVFN
ncbi:MAG: hypothetical protein P1P93_08715 [Gammaproteobacteria bacterium]|nr:hypothetical protein [Gammaproteobacteria bacterium]